MLSGPFALALAAGMAATVNPCGFAMLPAYLAMFLGDSSNDTAASGAAPGSRNIGRAFTVSAALTAGFVAVFGLFGLIISPLAVSVEQYLPWATIVIGIVLVVMGVALVGGREVTVALPKLARGGKDGGLRSMFVFGISYAIASLSCTIGPFLAVTSTTLASQNLASGVAMFVVYGLGMGLVVTALTVAVAFARAGLVARMRGWLPYISRVSGALLVLAGAYVAWYGWFEVRVLGGGSTDDPIIDRALDVQSWIQSRLVPDRPAVAAALIGGMLAVVAVGVLVRRRRGSAAPSSPPGGTDSATAETDVMESR